MSKKSKAFVKQDVCFLEYPLWFQDTHTAEQCENGYVWRDLEGFIYRAGYKPPVKLDRIILLYLTLKSQNEGWKEEIELSRFEILTACRIGTGKREYERLEDSLKRWKMIGIEFQGTFYNGKDYDFINFGIIDDWEIEKESKNLKVRFSSRWLQQQQCSNFFKYVAFNEIRDLRSPLAIRLYEILLKSFQGREKWEIDTLKLAQKIPMNEKHPAHIIPKIKSAVNRINERTELKLELEIRRPERGKAVCVFRKMATSEHATAQSEYPVVWDVSEEKRGELEGLLELVPGEHRHKKTVLEVVSRFLRKKGEEYTRENILYTNEHEPNNYRAYLTQALRQNFAAQQEPPKKQQKPPSSSLAEPCPHPEKREVSDEEVEAELNRRLKEMPQAALEFYLRGVRVELAQERFQEDPTIHPDKIPQRDVQKRLFQKIREELRSYLAFDSLASL